MQALRDFVSHHTMRNACRCGKCMDCGDAVQLQGHTIDMWFFDVCAVNDPDPTRFKELILANKAGEFVDLAPLDGRDHSYIELGGWLGSQDLALRFMGLGVICGLWKIRTPKLYSD